MKKTIDELKAQCDQLVVMALGPRPDFELNVPVHPPTFIRVDRPDTLRISAEEPVSGNWLDYWGNYRGGCPWIHPTLEKWASDQGMFWEWDDPGSIALYEA